MNITFLRGGGCKVFVVAVDLLLILCVLVCNAVLYLSLHSLLIAYINLFQIDLKYVHIYLNLS